MCTLLHEGLERGGMSESTLQKADVLLGKWHIAHQQLPALIQDCNLPVQPVVQRQIPLYFITDTVNKEFFFLP